MTERLDQITIPFHTLVHGDQFCLNECHAHDIERYYRDIVKSILYADSFLPRTKPSCQKPIWSEALNDLKHKSIECCKTWRVNCSPKYGTLFSCGAVSYTAGRSDLRMTATWWPRGLDILIDRTFLYLILQSNFVSNKRLTLERVINFKGPSLI